MVLIMKKITIILFSLVLTLPLMAQKQERKQIREGNKLYEKGEEDAAKYTEAEIAYRKALEADAHSPQATMNLGNALYKQGKGQDALDQYQLIIHDETDPKRLATAWHNAGNVCMQGQDYASAVQAYRQSLINNPSDDETRYNLAMAQALLKAQQQQQQQEQQQDQKEEKKDEQQQEQQQQQQNQQEQQQPEEQQQEQMSQEQAQQLIDALMQDEQEVQEKVKQLQMMKGQRSKTNKDW